MGLDVYVGSFTRYYAGDWETIVQQMGREQGLAVRVIRPQSADAITDPEEIRPAILSWRDELSRALGPIINRPLDWDESSNAPYFTDKPGRCYSSLREWADHCERLPPPTSDASAGDGPANTALPLSSDSAFPTAFPQLRQNVEIWLPHDFSFVFRAPDPVGRETCFGSSVALLKELDELNDKSWQATEAMLAEWRRNGVDDSAMETQARFVFAIMHELTRQAVAHRLIMKLDY